MSKTSFYSDMGSQIPFINDVVFNKVVLITGEYKHFGSDMCVSGTQALEIVMKGSHVEVSNPEFVRTSASTDIDVVVS